MHPCTHPYPAGIDNAFVLNKDRATVLVVLVVTMGAARYL
jgi:hypothetical protein